MLLRCGSKTFDICILSNCFDCDAVSSAPTTVVQVYSPQKLLCSGCFCCCRKECSIHCAQGLAMTSTSPSAEDDSIPQTSALPLSLVPKPPTLRQTPRQARLIRVESRQMRRGTRSVNADAPTLTTIPTPTTASPQPPPFTTQSTNATDTTLERQTVVHTEGGAKLRNQSNAIGVAKNDDTRADAAKFAHRESQRKHMQEKARRKTIRDAVFAGMWGISIVLVQHMAMTWVNFAFACAFVCVLHVIYVCVCECVYCMLYTCVCVCVCVMHVYG